MAIDIPPQPPLSLAHSHHMKLQSFTKKFNRLYDQFYLHRDVDKPLLTEISNTLISMDLFDKITLGKRYQGRMALVDGKVRFDEIPLPPHGQVFSFLTMIINQSVGAMLPGAILMPCGDNGINTPFDSDANREDIVLSPIRKKRPDASWRLQRHLLPNPPPCWLKFDARGFPIAHVVVEVAVENESPDTFRADCDAYFGADTSTTLWVGVKIWLAEQRFWVGYAERAADGVGATIHSQMLWVPNHSSFLVPTNITYQIPMQTVFGPGIAIPPGTPATLDIHVEMIRQRIVESI
jgi:hypothetical protein